MIKHYLLYLALFFCFTARAEKTDNERVFVHTDKDCYVAGEEIWVKFLVFNPGFRFSALSKTGYVEICDTEKPYIQLKLALEDGQGAGKVKIPAHIPSGIYQLSGYTRFMRNEGENVFFKRQIAIINVGRQTDTDRIHFVPAPEKPETNYRLSTIGIATDRKEYANRSRVQLSLDHLPENIIDLVVSVSRDDSVALLPKTDKQTELDRIKQFSPVRQPLQWLPEYEGHIVGGTIIPAPDNKSPLTPNLSVVGKTIRFVNGKILPGTENVQFYTAGIYGHQQVVASVVSNVGEKTPYRLDISSPFHEFLPEKLPQLPVYPNEKRLMERHIGAQLNDLIINDTLAIPLKDYYRLPEPKVYDLDEYTRFTTISETLFEYVYTVRVNKKSFQVYSQDEQSYNTALVLLDGIPVYDHKQMLEYDPYLIKKLIIYDGRFSFGGQAYGSIVLFVTYQGNLQSFRLSDESQLFEYDFPELPTLFQSPDYSGLPVKNARTPDFRHTLYWNPFVNPTNGKPVQLDFYTSDLSGEFEVKVEGITADGKSIYGTCRFRVTSAPFKTPAASALQK
jgi:hypothetical protein